MQNYAQQIQKLWYQPLKFPWLLLTPLAAIYKVIIAARKILYKLKICARFKAAVPVIVVGNITVGGSGKTPMVLYLVAVLRQQGYHPGIISRGYGGSYQGVLAVQSNTNANLVGDEAVLLAQRSNCPVVVGKNRAAAAQFLCNNFAVDLIISDDGLQHYGLCYNLAIVMFDLKRGFGNGWLLPVGPLRDSLNSLANLGKAKLLVVNAAAAAGPAAELQSDFLKNNKCYFMHYSGKQLYNLLDRTKVVELTALHGKIVHAVAAIADPSKFFEFLRQAGLIVVEHPFIDHYQFKAKDLNFVAGHAVIVTEKDAVKLQDFATDNFWVLPITAKLEEGFAQQLIAKVQELKAKDNGAAG